MLKPRGSLLCTQCDVSIFEFLKKEEKSDKDRQSKDFFSIRMSSLLENIFHMSIKV